MSCPDCELLRYELNAARTTYLRAYKRLLDIADAFGSNPNDQRDLCVKAREAGAKIEVLTRRVQGLETRVIMLQARNEGERAQE